MKRILALVLALVLLVGLFPAGAAAEQSEEKREYPFYLGDPDDTLEAPFPVYFLDGVDDLPYLEMDDMLNLLVFLNQDCMGDDGYKLSCEYNYTKVTVKRENGYSVTFDFDKGTITFDDYDAFQHSSNDTTLIDLLSETGFDENGQAQLFQRDKEKSFDRYGDMKTFNLNDYGIKMDIRGEQYFIPMQTVSDIFVAPALGFSLLFNGQALFAASDDLFFDYGEGEYTPLAGLYYEAAPTQRSDALSEYSYNELCMVLDNLYGLKGPHDINTFAETFWQIGIDEALRSNNPTDADNALKMFIDYYLDDLHSVFDEYSWMAGKQDISNSTGMANRKIREHGDAYGEARAAKYPDGVPAYEEVGNTAYITFDSFDSRYIGQAYYTEMEDGQAPDDTIALIIHAHEQITRPDSPIENVVLDLSNNLGGAVDAAIFVLGWMLGDAPFSVKNMSTGAMSTSIYRADVNLDRQFDDSDTVADKHLYCLISPVSFSCGNLVPNALKSSQKVTLLGRTSGGGSCTVQSLSTAYGTVFQISSSKRMSFLKNGSFYDIDQGIDPDYYINDIANFYDREALTQFINGLF